MRFGSFGGVSSGVGFFGVVGELKPGLVFGCFGLPAGSNESIHIRVFFATSRFANDFGCHQKSQAKFVFSIPPKWCQIASYFFCRGGAWKAEEAFKTTG